MKYKVALLCLLCAVEMVCASDLIVDENIKIGKLENGLTYYIKKNGFPADKAALSLLVKAGSLHETEEERGLAHFVEHMAFRGSENFSDWEMIHYFESIGAKFGPDTNAYTTFDRTEYMLEIPLEQIEALDKGLFMLSDIAGRLSFDETLLHKERTVIFNEYTETMKNVYFHGYRNLLDLLLPGSRHSERLPIGLKEIILEAPPKAVRGFYDKWYRPERIAIIAVGDFDVEAVERSIEKFFSPLVARAEAESEPDLTCSVRDNREVFVMQDPEIVMLTGYLSYLKEQKLIGTDEIKEFLAAELFALAMQSRFYELAAGCPAPFMQAGWSQSSNYIDDKDIEMFFFVGFEDKPLVGLEALYQEVLRYKAFGLSKEEFLKVKEQKKEFLKEAMSTLSKISHREFVSKWVQNFMDERTVFEDESILLCLEKSLDEISLEEMNHWVQNMIQPDKYHVFFQTSKEDFPSVEKIKECIHDWEAKESTQIEHKAAKELVVSEHEKSATIILEEVYTNYHLLTLDNGMQVVLHPSSEEKENVSVEYIALGGKTLFDETVYPSIGFGELCAFKSGLANLDKSEFVTYLQSKNLSMQFSIGTDLRSVFLMGTTAYAEELLKMGKAAFTERRFDEAVWESLIEEQREIFNSYNHNPKFFFETEVGRALFSDHPFYKDYPVGEADFEKAKQSMDIAFGDPSQFILVIVGDFDINAMKELVVRYGNYPKGSSSTGVSTLIPRDIFSTEDLTKEIRRGKEGNARSTLAFGRKNTFSSMERADIPLKGLKEILEARLFDKMRQDLGSIYWVSLAIMQPFWPTDLETVLARIDFVSEENKADLLQNEAMSVIQEFLKEGPTDEEISKARELLLQRVKTGFQSNQIIRSFHTRRIAKGIDIVDEETRKREVIEYLTRENIMKAAEMIFKEEGPIIRMTLLPEIVD